MAQDCTGEEYIELRNTIKKTSTENLIKKLNKAGFTLDDLKPIISDRIRLIDECLVLYRFGKSSLRMATPVTAEGGGGDLQSLLKFMLQESAKRDEQAKLDRELAQAQMQQQLAQAQMQQELA